MIRASSVLFTAGLLFAGLTLSSCSGGECVPVQDDGDDTGLDPYAGWQDIQLSADVIEVTDAEWGTDRTVEVTVSNEGNADLAISSATLESWSAENWEFDPADVPEELGPGESVTLEVVFHNTSEEDSYAALSIYSNDPDQERVAVGFVGRSNLQRPDARLSPLVLDFGFRYPGQGTSDTLTVTNHGDAALTLGSLTLDQAATDPEDQAFSLLSNPSAIEGLELAGGESVPIEVAFVPLNSLNASAELSVGTDDPQHPELSALIRGNGEGAAGCTAPTIGLDEPLLPFELALGVGNSLVVSATVADDEQPPSGMLVELLLGDTLIEDEFSGADGATFFDIPIDTFEVENVWAEFPTGLNTFRVRVTDACPRSSEVRFVANIGGSLDPADQDGDGYSESDGDCDDADISSYPGAAEILDAIDNDCDGSLDEETAAWDDDCDGYCESPPCLGQGPAVQAGDSCEGLAADSDDLADCDDRTSDSDHDGSSDGSGYSPALAEVADHQDQNCDGSIDEGTAYADGDGDGQTGLAGDCDDEDPTRFSGAVEYCNEIDNDCDGTTDEDCIETLLAPRFVGDVLTDRYEIPFGAVVEAHATVLSDDDSLTWEWSTDVGGITSATNQPTITWEAPEATEANLELQGTFANLLVTVTDSRGRSASAFGVIRFVSDDDGPSYSAVGGENCGCSALASRAEARPLALLLVVALALGTLRRRSQGSPQTERL